MRTWELSDTNVLTIKIKADSRSWHQDFLLRSDAHHDNAKCDHRLERQHLDEAVDRDALVMDFGDLFCVMQGRGDDRRSLSHLRTEDSGDNYINRVVRSAESFYKPYASRWVVMAHGNHETKFTKNYGADMTGLLSDLLNAGGSSVYSTGYTGWVRIMVERRSERRSFAMWYGHGWTKGVRQRMPMILDGADLVYTGHEHAPSMDEAMRVGLSPSGKVVKRRVIQLGGATYKDEYGNGEGGWATEKGHHPRPLGAWWLRLSFDGSNGLHAEVNRAT